MGAALLRGDGREGLVDMEASARPGGLGAHRARRLPAHARLATAWRCPRLPGWTGGLHRIDSVVEVDRGRTERVPNIRKKYKHSYEYALPFCNVLLSFNDGLFSSSYSIVRVLFTKKK